ncbi:MAG: SGNH/GDSL hydrolase family protein [Planctomycetota bacterium]
MEKFLAKLKSGEKTVVVALGDSITELTWHTMGHLNWCGLLQEALFETYGRDVCWVINSGLCGDTAAGSLARLDDDVLRFHPDLVIISYGMNDPETTTLEQFRQDLRSLVERVRARAGAEVLLRTPNPIVNPPTAAVLREGQDVAVETTGTQVGLFAQAIVDVARETGCPVVDHYTSWKRLESLRGAANLREEPNHLWLYMSDPKHPGPLGHLAFFRDLAPLFRVPSHFPWEIPPS